MPLPATYAKGVLFIGRREVDGDRIGGTGFLVTIVTGLTTHAYVVTARHVVETSDRTFIRYRTTEGDSRDEDVDEWIYHADPNVDVAVAGVGDKLHDPDLIATGLTQFIDEPGALEHEPELGDVVYFIGLLGKVKSMEERNIPMVRAGFLGALWQEDIPVQQWSGGPVSHITAHLIDCRSFGGFSGSPCYLQHARAGVVQRDDGAPGITTKYQTSLLGLIGGHFDDWTKVKERLVIPDEEAERLDEDAGFGVSNDIKAPVSTGVGYVIPAEFIRATLMREDLIQAREDEERTLRETANRPGPA